MGGDTVDAYILTLTLIQITFVITQLFVFFFFLINDNAMVANLFSTKNEDS